ncbi:MAG: hypothetical protein ACYDBB_07865 [Armatimonadota bacterium]
MAGHQPGRQGDGVHRAADLAPQFNPPVLQNGLLFGISDRGFFFCINAKTGTAAWMDTVKRESGGFGTLLNAGAVLLALTSNGELAALAPNEKEYTELARIKLADTATYAGPVVAGKRIFIKDKEALTLWMME